MRTRWLNLNGRVNSLTAMLGNPCCYRHRAQPDSGGGGRITPQANFFFSARNLFNELNFIMGKVGANAPIVQCHEVNGINGTCAIKHVF